MKTMTKGEGIKKTFKRPQNSQGCTKCSEAYLDCVHKKISLWLGAGRFYRLHPCLAASD